MKPRLRAVFGFIAGAGMGGLLSACSPEKTVRLHTEGPDPLLMEEAAACIAIGPRHAGSEGAGRTAEWIMSRIRPGGGQHVSIRSFEDMTPTGKMKFRNVILEMPGKRDETIVVGAHYDTKYFPDNVKFEGANDGASGVAALLAVIRYWQKNPPPVNLMFCFFDGEEARFRYGRQDGLHGSRHEVSLLQQNGKIKNCKAMILLDMIGDKDLRIAIPRDTPPVLQSIVMQAADNIGASKYVVQGGPVMLDDHTPFAEAGIPAIDLIDFQYGPCNSYWHTPEDSLDKISGESMQTATDLTVEMIRLIAKEM